VGEEARDEESSWGGGKKGRHWKGNGTELASRRPAHQMISHETRDAATNLLRVNLSAVAVKLFKKMKKKCTVQESEFESKFARTSGLICVPC
jgi:hypothetical protein